MGPLRVSNVLWPDNRVAGPWVGWAHGGVCSVCGRAQWPWRVLRTAGVAGVRGYLWARVRWVLGSSGVGAFCVRARLGPGGVVRILVEVRTLLCGAYSGCGWAPPYLCVWSGHLAAGRFLCTAPGPVAVSVFCVCLGSLWGVFCVLLWAVPGMAGAWRRGAYSVRGFGFILFVMRWIIPLCLILIAFFPPFPGACRNLAQKPLI